MFRGFMPLAGDEDLEGVYYGKIKIFAECFNAQTG
jgi:hypothetical protein